MSHHPTFPRSFPSTAALSCFRACALVLLVALALVAPAAADGPLVLTALESDVPTGKAKLPRGEITPSLDGLDMTPSIESIYERFRSVSAESGYELSFTISDVQTLGAEALDEVYWLDLFSQSVGPVIETVPYERVGALPSESIVNYRSKWNRGAEKPQRAEDVFGEVLRADEVLERLAEHDPKRFAGVSALSSFAVKVDFEGRSRDYRAITLWKPLSTGRVLFSIADHVVPGVELSFHENRPVVDQGSFEALVAGPLDATDGEKDLCMPRTVATVTGSPLNTGPLTNGHVFGSHSGALTVQRVCSINAICESICSPSAQVQACEDSGLTGFIHRTFNTVKISTVPGAPTQRGECAYGWGCAVKECPFGICGSATFGVSGAGVSFSISATSAVLSDMSLSDGGSCPPAFVPTPCQEPSTNLTVLPLGVDAPALHLPTKAFPLTRVEGSDVTHHGLPLSYLLGEWALVSIDGDAVKTVRTSSRDFAASKAGELGPLLQDHLAEKAGPRQALVVAMPPHEANSRKIPMPELGLSGARVPAGTPAGRVLVRADFDEQHKIQGLQVLSSSFGDISRELALELERALQLERLSNEDHRVIVFAEIAIDGDMIIERTLPYLPKCCCLGGTNGTVCP